MIESSWVIPFTGHITIGPPYHPFLGLTLPIHFSVTDMFKTSCSENSPTQLMPHPLQDLHAPFFMTATLNLVSSDHFHLPKEKEVSTPDRFRPIALCNVIYKVISKVITNTIKPMLPILVSKEKVGFVEARHILDNIIQAHEIINSCKVQRKEGMIMKLDITKAHDKLNWVYLVDLLKSFN